MQGCQRLEQEMVPECVVVLIKATALATHLDQIIDDRCVVDRESPPLRLIINSMEEAASVLELSLGHGPSPLDLPAHEGLDDGDVIRQEATNLLGTGEVKRDARCADAQEADFTQR